MMLSGEDIADLWEPRPHAGKRWVDQIPEDARAWCEAVAAGIRERGKEPTSWSAVNRRFEELFGSKYVPKSHQTLMNSIRALARD